MRLAQPPDLGEAKVDDADVAAEVDEDVLGLEVAVEDVDRVDVPVEMTWRIRIASLNNDA